MKKNITKQEYRKMMAKRRKVTCCVLLALLVFAINGIIGMFRHSTDVHADTQQIALGASIEEELEEVVIDEMLEENVKWLSMALYTEINLEYVPETGKVRASSDEAMRWVAAVLVNRMESKLFPNTMEGVVTQGNGVQVNGLWASDWGVTTERTDRIAREALTGEFSIDSKVLWYHNPYISNQKYVKSMESYVVYEVGGHVFCNNDGRWSVASK